MYNYYRHLLTYLIIKRKQLPEVLSLKPKEPCRVFVILCEPRSGSTLLHTYLNSHSRIKSHGEILREKVENGLTGKSLTEFLTDKIMGRKSSTLRAVGVKLFYRYFENPDYQDAFNTILNRKDVLVIHLVRKDHLKLFVSLKIAQASTVWSINKSSNQINRIAINPEEYLKYAHRYQDQQQQFDALFKRHSQLNISYEELVENPKQTLRQVQLFLGVSPQDLFSLLKKQNPNSLESIVSNYREIQEFDQSRAEGV